LHHNKKGKSYDKAKPVVKQGRKAIRVSWGDSLVAKKS